jgi:hypothetical protein
MAIWACNECGGSFSRETLKAEKARFCGTSCYRLWQRRNPNAGAFKPGLEPHNKGVKGVHYSPATEFKKGQRGLSHVAVGTERKRLDKHTKTPRIWVKVAEPNQWRLRAVLVYERANGPVKHGLVVHHIDHNSLNDAPGNLEALTRSQHMIEHHRELSAAKAVTPERRASAEVA